ncbi:unnamed protein product [Lampetra fluviatilis]
MNHPSCFIAFQLFATLILPSESATISNGLREVIKGGCNETTHYLSTRGICCELCQAGNRKVMDCVPHSGTFCTSCEPGEDYTDEPNSSNECKKCTVCNLNFEKTESRCAIRQDTRCRCRDGFQRAAPSDPCTEVKGDTDIAGAIAGAVIGAVMITILLVAAVGLLLYRIRNGHFPWERSRGAIRRNIREEVVNLLKVNSLRNNVSGHDEVNSAEDFIGQMITEDQEGNWKDVERELPELREWISKTPSLFLHELKRRNVITEEEYWRAFTIPDAAKRADSILLPVMRQGDVKRRELLEILEQQRSRERHFLDMLKMSHVCSPTLNPNSAHQHLQISADLSTVTWNQEDQPYSDHTERFEWWPIVLCFETFSSGDHYWEVDVRASKNCSIGIACESIPRNRQEKSGRLSWNEKSWAFVQWDSNYSARYGDQCIPYPDIKHLQRVGIRLDFNAEKLSFYNASTMELLHSFYDISSGPLFPAFHVKSGSVMIYEAQSFKNLAVDESREDIRIFDHFANSGVHPTKNTNSEKGDSEDTLLRTTTEEPLVVRDLIGRIPAILHRELLVQGLITQSELSEAYSMPLASERADFIISFLDRQQAESPKLQEILHQHREKQEAFLKMRRESIACSPTLNPNTAHWNLQISADLKTVRTSTHTQPYPDNSDRFDHYRVVICSDKFSSGRHYWEVDSAPLKRAQGECPRAVWRDRERRSRIAEEGKSPTAGGRRGVKMNLPSCFIAFQSFAMLILTSESATISNGLQEVIKGGCNETTHYLSSSGICCELCQAGKRKLMDCESNKTGSFCTDCHPGKDYTDELNSSNECKKCTVCNVNSEDTERTCTTRQDTRCRCRDGFQRAAPSDPCTDAKDKDGAGAIAVPVVAVVLILLVAIVGLLLYRNRHKCFPWERSRGTRENIPLNTDEELLNWLKMNSLCSNIVCHDEVNSIEDLIGKIIARGNKGNWKDVKRELPELREWIGKTPSLFLHELKRGNVVTEDEYWRAFTVPDAAMRADSILLHVMIRGEGKRRKLLKILEQQRSRERHFLDMLKTSHVCSPTLNPNSAHRQLQISADLSTATWNQPYSDHAERFEWWPIVLCFETFSSGDHYWEVDVRASKNCSIGVTRGSIPWNHQKKSERLGWNESSWAFVQWDSNYSAKHGDQSIPYPEIMHLQRVGVHLDFNAGKLSFYNAITMELLRSFNDISSEPLCPAMEVKSGSVAIYEVQSFKNLTVDESREDIQICDHVANSGDHRTNNTDANKGASNDALLRTWMEAPPVVQELIGRIPAMLHRELLAQGLITQYEFSEVYLMPLASERVNFMVRRLNRKKRKKSELQDILHQHREKQEAFLKMRRESSTCSPTLNPNTAHRNLQISADFKTVRTSTRTQPYPDNSDRFSHYQVVICSEKFSSGRHYWEVDVRGSEKFNIGVTYDAISRKGDDQACKIGFNEVSWSLKKRGNDYTALHNEMETNLSVRDAPKRVGVHLDWEAGVLSFYSADSMSLLHRFHGKFDRELYPAMAVLHKSLAICPLPYADALH